MKRLIKTYIHPHILFAFLALVVGSLRAQTTVIMPHQDTAVLYINQSNCYTILDPGGLAHYGNNEDSWLYIISDNNFILNIDYATGASNDGNDFIDIYRDTTLYTNPNTPYSRYCGTGTSSWSSYYKRAVIHFHSNSNVVYDGFVITLKFVNTISNVNAQNQTPSSAQINWYDSQTGVSEWTVHYYCDEDSIQMVTTSTNSATLTGLRNNTYYAYYITNDVDSCMNYSVYYLLLPNSDHNLYLTPSGYSSRNILTYGNCYTLFNSTGPGNNQLGIANEQLTLSTLDSCPFYVTGRYSLGANASLYGYVWNRVTNTSAMSHGSQSHGEDLVFCPTGQFQMSTSNDPPLQYRILWENTATIHPSVSNITANSATLSWTDLGGSSSYKVGYACDESQWQYIQTSTPSVTLSGLLPARQYLFTIQGNVETDSCIIPARHAFTTAHSSDTLIMGYRSNDTLFINPTSCYTILDPGASNNYFRNDHSQLTILSSNGKGFRITGSYNISSSDYLYIYDGSQWNSYYGGDGRFYLNCPNGSAQFCFYSNNQNEAPGFSFSINQPDTAIHHLQVTGITTNSATISWNDASESTEWEVHYGTSENNFLSAVTTTPNITLTGLDSATQYVYYVTIPEHDSPCFVPERRGFITSGLPENTSLMPYRGTDTIWVDPGTCYNIWDAGGENNDYFDYDTSNLVILSTDGSDFYIMGGFDYKDNYDYSQYGYDGRDILRYSRYQGNNNSWSGSISGSYSLLRNNPFRQQSSNGFLRLQFCSNHNFHRMGYHFTIDHDPSSISNVVFSHLLQTSVDISWNDNGSTGPWTIYYTPEGGTTLSTTSTTRNVTLSSLTPSTTYIVSITNSSETPICNLRKHEVTTLSTSDIVMRFQHHDTVFLHPDSCYTIYDPGGLDNYLPSDNSSLVLKTTTGLGFMLKGNVYRDDRYDTISYSTYNPNGQARIVVKTNEALQSQGFAFKVIFYPTIRQVDTLQVTDSSTTITWQDTSVATRWTVHYGPRRDSMQTITTSTPQVTLTGLRRNTQCFIEIENDFGSPDCKVASIYGLLMPHDNDYWICQYVNRQLNDIGIHSLFEHTRDVLPTDVCPKIYSNSGPGSLFPNDYCYHYFYNTHNAGGYLGGDYSMGDASGYVSTSPFSKSFYNTGSFYTYIGSTYFSIRTSSDNMLASYPEGFVLSPSFFFPIYNIQQTSLSCTTYSLSWQDSSSATQWFIAYGTSEHSLDTITCSQRNHTFSSLTPDRQYVCYLWNNMPSSSCFKPVKYYLLTSCDSTYIIMPGNASETRYLSIDSCYTVSDPGGPNDYFFLNTQTLYLRSITGDPFVLRGWIELSDNNNANVRIYDETSRKTLLSCYGSQSNIEVRTDGPNIRIEFSNPDTITDSGFEFQIRFNSIYNIRTDLMTDTSCRMRWDDHSSGSQWFVHYGSDKAHMTTIPTNEKQVHLSGLSDGTLYYVYITNNAAECIDTTWFQFCAGGGSCIDFANLYSCKTQPHYGYTYNPDYYSGVVDYGSDSILSRHTVIDDTTLYDPRTGNQLRCTPPGEGHAVRLGNWDIGGGAESITYEYVVDSSINNILLLRYAAVLENPSHSADNQPRFRFAIVDEYGNELDHQCYSADFVSSTELGWNQYSYDTNYILWKDWTPVGIDLEPFHGQRIFVKLTTYDCGEMGHFGYAYFHLSCSQKNIRVGACGVVDTNVFTAPEGFRYKWYNIDSADVTLSTERTFHSDEAGIYRCRCSFVGNNSNNCYFEKTVVVGSVFPYAAFRHEVIDTNECNIAVKFYNQSCVATDSNRTHLTSMECDDFFWDFGDGTTSTDINPTHNFAPGHYEVTLRSSLAGLECSHDSTFILSTASPCIRFDTLRPVICHNASYTFLDTTLYTPDTTLVYPPTEPVLQSHFVRREYRPDSIVETTIFLTINPVYWNDTAIIACDSFYWSQTDSTYFFATTADKLWQNQYGCDSSYHLQLQVEPSFDTTATASACSNVGYILFNDTIFQSGTYIDSLHTVYGCDSLLRLSITIHPAYNADTFATACDKFFWSRRDTTYRLDTLASRSLLCRDTLPTILNCDSIFTLHLDLHPSYNLYDSIYLCRFETYHFNGQDYTAPDAFTYSLSSSHNCDSTHNVSLFIHDTLFRADWLLSADSATWSSDTLFEVCTPFTLYGRSQSVNAVSLEWIFDDSETSLETSVAHPYEAGTYRPALIAVSDHNCRDTLTLTHPITVFPSPEAHFYWDPANPSDGIPQATFLNTSTPNDSTCSYLWNFQKADGSEEMDTSSLFSPTYVWDVAQLQEPLPVAVQLIAYQTFVAPSDSLVTCTDTLTDTVTILSDFLQFPNLVTPNGDGTNDTWIIVNLLEYNRYPINHLIIYDRWGHVVYNVENISSQEQFWDPAATQSPDGTYFFVFTGRGEHNEYSIRRTGAIELLGSGNKN